MQERDSGEEMADLALSAAQTLFGALECTVLKDICSIWGYKDELEDLKKSVSTIHKVLLDAETHRELSHEARDYIEKLKDGVYDADDLFDEVLTLAELKQYDKGSKLSAKVRTFFSSKNNPLSVAYTTSKEVKRIKKLLEAIASDHSKYGFQVDSKPIRERREETCSYVYAPDIIGRENDKKDVIDRLLDFHRPHQEDVGFLTIVGVGGLGKTTLAQLVYDDERVKQEFSLRLWACVSDQDGEKFDVKVILSKILDSFGCKPDNGSSKEQVQNQFQKKLGGRKCFLVLDDVWNENRYEWGKLKGFLMGFGRGSRIVATTRSKETARIIGDGDTYTYELTGLSDEHSWDLFELAAFGKGHGYVNAPELVEIGEKIVEQCSNVPLMLKVVGSILFGQERSKWQAFEEMGLAKATRGDNQSMSILKLSYDNLESQLKSCFSYCAVFPKDFRIEKDMLISLWMAQGYIKPFYSGQSMTEAGKEHFLILLRRCFFQDVVMDEFGDVVSCKIHDLMHDVAQQVARKEICMASTMRNKLSDDHKVRHLFEDEKPFVGDFYCKSKIRSYVQLFWPHSDSQGPWTIVLDPLVTNWVNLRSLSLEGAANRTLPDSIGKLLHLRHLNLKWCTNLETLPNSITKLHNLQTLILGNCGSLEELPKDLSKLVNLGHLDIQDCSKLKYMPASMNKLTSLAVLTHFIVADGDLNGNQCCYGELKDMKALKNLEGRICIKFPVNYNSVGIYSGDEGGYLSSKERLKSVEIHFQHANDEMNVITAKDEPLIGELRPHSNLRAIKLYSYYGRTIPRWGRAEDNWATFLPNLVYITIYRCYKLRHLPMLSELQHLRSLTLVGLSDLEYIGEDTTSISTKSYGAEKASSKLISEVVPFFPSLERLVIEDMSKLKGWWGGKREEVVASFPCLRLLDISHCPNLMSFPLCPSLEVVNLLDCNAERLRLITTSDSNLKVRKVTISDMADLLALPPCHPTSISIKLAKVESFRGAGEVAKTHGSCSVQNLEIILCGQLKTLSGGGFQYFTALKSLIVSYCPELLLNDEDDGDGIPWRSLRRTLSSMRLYDVYYMESLPKGMQYLTSLKSLTINGCMSLKTLPEWISGLSSLHSLDIGDCSDIESIPEAMQGLTSLSQLHIKLCSQVLEKRCREPDGQDWPKIQHIPDVLVISRYSRFDSFND